MGLESMLQNEFLVLVKVLIGHENTPRLVDHFETAKELYSVTEMAYGGELFDRIVRSGKLEEPHGCGNNAVLYDVSYLHANNIVHRNLKAEYIRFGSRTGLERKTA